VIGGKWKTVILCHLTHATKRTSEPGKMLTQQLPELEADGVINRIVSNQVPPKVECDLSEYGWSLQGILDSLCHWGETHIEKVYGDTFEVLEEGILNDQSI
jgi:DNA-binding HxlR family transcriptional regulator